MYLASLATMALALVAAQTASAQEIGHGVSDGLPYDTYVAEGLQHDSYAPSPRPARYRDPTPAIKLPDAGKFSGGPAQVLRGEFVRTEKPNKEERRKITGQNLAQALDDFGDYYDDEMKLRPAPMDGGAGIEYRVFLGGDKSR